MGYIKEPIEIDLTVDSTPLTIEDKKKISEIIAYFKATGKKSIFPKLENGKRLTKKLDIVL